ncbi:L-carnitine CoA-transferase [Salana multivorans]|uniref:L-carnitine CoA-transferase n=1 Tax=Salana multivorans TaxID=120377 RepID=A0A3N2D8C4_9MICO|nr:L-carnitine CoA-transferase [Salana multivorans]MBN8881908.1 L-carnitine CoA-transferase [Salana multivorans]ROR96020.1 L-carnitine CoA-transferase [Salana multivorans]
MTQRSTSAIPGFGPLEGVRVVYSAVEIAAPTAAALLSEWGAEVIWIENTRTGDSMRDTTYVKELERRNQRSIAMNPFSEEGRTVLFELLRDADIFIESSKGPTYARRGLTDDVLWEHNPALVIAHVSGFGQYGVPERVNRAAYDLTVQAYSGYLAQNGTPEQPMAPLPYVGDYFTSEMVAASVLAALTKARATGQGESIDIAMYEVMLRIGAYYYMDYLNAGTRYPRPGARHPNLCGIGEYACKDGYIGLCVYGVPQNKYLLERIGLGHLWGTEEYPEDTAALWLDGPKAELIEQRLDEFCLTQNRFELEEEFSAVGIAANAILEFEDLDREEHLRQREAIVEWENTAGDTVRGIGIVPKFTRSPGRIWRPMPELGQDTDAVLTEAGFTPERIAELEANGTIRRG